MSILKNIALWTLLLSAGIVQDLVAATAEGAPSDLSTERPVVYMIPVNEGIHQANLYVLRRGLKEAIRKEADMVLLDMDTPGGAVDICLEMMEMLSYFKGETATYVNSDAISAGAFIASATDAIYFAPNGKMGAAAVIQGSGEDVPETARLKVESYLLANIRLASEGFRYRADVIRAMMDADYELVIEGAVIKPSGSLLTVTAKQAMELYGDPEFPLLGAGIYESAEDLLDAKYGSGAYELEALEITYSMELAKWLAGFASVILGAGMLLLFIEFKTPGFGIFGIGGIALLGVFFMSHYLAGLAGNEAILIFVFGILFLGIEVLILPGVFIFGILGLIMLFGSLLMAMSDFWPGGVVPFSSEVLFLPLQNLFLGLSIAVIGALIMGRIFKGSFIEKSIVLDETLGGKDALGGKIQVSQYDDLIGREGIALTRLNPSGMIKIDNKNYEAHSEGGYIDKDAVVVVCSADNFKIDVKVKCI